ncbi:MAG: hypothetical protein JSS20_16915 [Proteobacteria bacterium]|nr:hypothetical protein [Pseudomonadota bacterium]
MSEVWARPVEQVLLSTAEAKARVVSIISPAANSGVSTLSAHVADASFRSGMKTLLANFSAPVSSDSGPGWSPAEAPAHVIKSNDGYDLLRIRTCPESRGKFNNITALQSLFNESLKAYDRIIVDLPPILHTGPDYINPLATARASDSVLMVCVTARTKQSQITEAVSVLDTAGVNLGGIVVNDVANAPLGQRIAGSARKLARWSEWLSAWLERKASKSEFLNTQL